MVRVMTVLAIGVTLAACGGGGGGGGSGAGTGPQSSPPPVQNASPGGIWEGTLATGEDVLGLVTESGEFHFITDSFTQYFGTVTTSGNSASGQFTGYTAVGYVFEDGSTRGSGTLTGTLQERATFTATTSFRTSAGNDVSNSVSLTYDPLYVACQWWKFSNAHEATRFCRPSHIGVKNESSHADFPASRSRALGMFDHEIDRPDQV